MMEKLKKFILSDAFRELVVYGIVGVLTTIINYVVYLLTSGPWASTRPSRWLGYWR